MTAYAHTAPVFTRPTARRAATAPVRPAPVRRSTRIVAIDSVAARRRRRTIAVVLLAIVVAIVGPRAVAGDEPTAPVSFDTYTVGSGETLWSIASSMTPAGDDVNETIHEIKELNAKGGSGLQTGEQLLIPAID